MAGLSYLHEVAITAIVIRKGKYLITRRSKNKKRFPGKWTIPGGKPETSDYTELPRKLFQNHLSRKLNRGGFNSIVILKENFSQLGNKNPTFCLMPFGHISGDAPGFRKCSKNPNPSPVLLTSLDPFRWQSI